MRDVRRTASALIASFLLVAASVSTSLAQDVSDHRTGPWELTVLGGLMDDQPEFEQERGSFDIEHEGIVGGRMGYHFDSGVFLDADLVYSPLQLAFRQEGRRERERLQALFFGGSLGYSFRPLSSAEFFVASGLGGVSWNADADGEVDFSFNAGGGFRYLFSRRLALRGHLRWHVVPAALAATRGALLPELNSPAQVLWLPELSAGLSIFLGNSVGSKQ